MRLRTKRSLRRGEGHEANGPGLSLWLHLHASQDEQAVLSEFALTDRVVGAVSDLHGGWPVRELLGGAELHLTAGSIGEAAEVERRLLEDCNRLAQDSIAYLAFDGKTTEVELPVGGSQIAETLPFGWLKKD